MSAVVATHEFWETFFSQRRTPPDPSEQSEALEWYVDVGVAEDHVMARLAECDRHRTRILHMGCGSSELGVRLSQKHGFTDVLDSDFSNVVVTQMRARFPSHSFVAMDAMAMPLLDSSVDVMICKVGAPRRGRVVCAR